MGSPGGDRLGGWRVMGSELGEHGVIGPEANDRSAFCLSGSDRSLLVLLQKDRGITQEPGVLLRVTQMPGGPVGEKAEQWKTVEGYFVRQSGPPLC